MAPTFKLTYFNVTGRGEPIRMLLAFGGFEFEDNRIEFKDWPKIKPTTPLGQAPVLEVDGKQLTQTIPICRYLANRVNLVGKDLDENYAIDAAVEILYDLLGTAYIFEFESKGEEKKKLEENLKSSVPICLAELDNDTKKNDGYIAIDRLSWADIFFVFAYEDLENIVRGPNILTKYPHLQQLVKKVLAIQNIRDYIDKRPPYNAYDLKKEI